VILGRAQLFTENTLYPVVLVLEDRRHLLPTARLWAVVLAANLAGALVFALLAVETGAISADFQSELVGLGEKALAGGFWPNFWSGIFAGWIIALIAWLVEASDAAIGRFVVIATFAFTVGLCSFDHAIASAAETFCAMVAGAAGVGHVAWWACAVILGNIIGGVFIVTVLNTGQVRG
jgi:formate/nitrite transporter FocA (FNT family)